MSGCVYVSTMAEDAEEVVVEVLIEVEVYIFIKEIAGW